MIYTYFFPLFRKLSAQVLGSDTTPRLLAGKEGWILFFLKQELNCFLNGLPKLWGICDKNPVRVILVAVTITDNPKEDFIGDNKLIIVGSSTGRSNFLRIFFLFHFFVSQITFRKNFKCQKQGNGNKTIWIWKNLLNLLSQST